MNTDRLTREILTYWTTNRTFGLPSIGNGLAIEALRLLDERDAAVAVLREWEDHFGNETCASECGRPLCALIAHTTAFLATLAATPSPAVE